LLSPFFATPEKLVIATADLHARLDPAAPGYVRLVSLFPQWFRSTMLFPKVVLNLSDEQFNIYVIDSGSYQVRNRAVTENLYLI